MLTQLIGTFDFPSMFVAIGLGAGLTIIIVVALTRQTKMQLQLESDKIKNAHDEALANIQTKREVEIAKTQQNLITSHRTSED